MAKFLKSYWANRVQLSANDGRRLQIFIREELKYYNALVTAFAGPVRTMLQAFTDATAYETILGIVAETAMPISALKASSLPAAFQPYKTQLFDEAGRLRLDDRTVFLADILAAPATLDRRVRREMALAIFRESRRQSRLLNTDNSDSGMPTIVEVLMPIDPASKRHIQFPRAAITTVAEKDDGLEIKLPCFEHAYTVSKPTASWNHVYVRLGFDGAVSLDLAFEDAPYALRKVDRAPSVKRAVR